MNYYIYVYCDPRKPGNYKFDNYEFDFEPIYIGKGNKNRIYQHLTRRKERKSFFYNKLNKIIKDGNKPIYYKLVENLSEEKSLEEEIRIISLIGRIDIESGPLCNCTEGGEKGFTKTKEARKKLSESKLGKKNPMYGKKTSEKQKNAVRKAHKDGRVKLSEEGRKKIIKNNKRRKGTKNIKKRNDSKIYELTDPLGNLYIIKGAVELSNFCSKHQIQYQLLRNFNGIVKEENLKSNCETALNTLLWKIKKN